MQGTAQAQSRGESEIVIESNSGATFQTIELPADDVIVRNPTTGEIIQTPPKTLVSDFLVRSLEVELVGFGNDLISDGAGADTIIAGKDFGSITHDVSALFIIGGVFAEKGSFGLNPWKAPAAALLADWEADATAAGVTVAITANPGGIITSATAYAPARFPAGGLDAWGLGVAQGAAGKTIDPSTTSPEINVIQDAQGNIVSEDWLQVLCNAAIDTLSFDLSLFSGEEFVRSGERKPETMRFQWVDQDGAPIGLPTKVDADPSTGVFGPDKPRQRDLPGLRCSRGRGRHPLLAGQGHRHRRQRIQLPGAGGAGAVQDRQRGGRR